MSSGLNLDDPLFDAGIQVMIEQIVNLSIDDYVNTFVYFRKHQDADPNSLPIVERKILEKECEHFFLQEYETMTGKDGERIMRILKEEGKKRKSYVNRKWASLICA